MIIKYIVKEEKRLKGEVGTRWLKAIKAFELEDSLKYELPNGSIGVIKYKDVMQIEIDGENVYGMYP